MAKKKILVAGGAGYIGSMINKMLNDAGYETVVFDNLSTGTREAVVAGTFQLGDLNDKNALDQLFSTHRFDGVFHFAAFIDVGISLNEPAKFYENNVVNTLNLLNAMRKFGVNTLIFSSTCAVYGTPATLPVNEMNVCAPINPYGQSKLMVEKILNDYHRAYGLRYCSLRYFNAAGGDPSGILKNTKSRETNLIPVILRSALTPQKEVHIFGTDYATPDGTCVRDYIHIYDLGTAHLAAMEQLFGGRQQAIYNLGNGNGFSVREVIAAAEMVTGEPFHIIESPRRAGDPPILVADATLARRELQWQPKYTDLESIISHAWNCLPKVAV